MGLLLRSLAPEANDCFMVGLCEEPTEYKVAARRFAPHGGLPSVSGKKNWIGFARRRRLRTSMVGSIVGETTRRASRTLAALAPATPVLRILDPHLALRQLRRQQQIVGARTACAVRQLKTQAISAQKLSGNRSKTP
jgi:hypothetical protein